MDNWMGMGSMVDIPRAAWSKLNGHLCTSFYGPDVIATHLICYSEDLDVQLFCVALPLSSIDKHILCSIETA